LTPAVAESTEAMGSRAPWRYIFLAAIISRGKHKRYTMSIDEGRTERLCSYWERTTIRTAARTRKTPIDIEAAVCDGEQRIHIISDVTSTEASAMERDYKEIS